MKRSDIDQPPCYFDRYIKCVEDIEISEAFAASEDALNDLPLAPLNAVGRRVYAEGKWTIKDIFRHLIDTEHILAYRALRIGRGDPTPLTGFDQTVLADHVSTEDQSLESLVDELKTVRRASRFLFASFTDEALQRRGIASGTELSALALGFTILGHQKYHLKIIDERYLPLVAERFSEARS